MCLVCMIEMFSCLDWHPFFRKKNIPTIRRRPKELYAQNLHTTIIVGIQEIMVTVCSNFWSCITSVISDCLIFQNGSSWQYYLECIFFIFLKKILRWSLGSVLNLNCFKVFNLNWKYNGWVTDVRERNSICARIFETFFSNMTTI